MISFAIQKSIIVAIIILIIHFLLKHVLYDQSISNPEFFQQRTRSKLPISQDHDTKREMKEEKDEEKEKVTQKQKDEEMKNKLFLNKTNKENDYIKIKDLENFINGGDTENALHKVKFQPRRPVVDPNAHIKPNHEDIYSFVLEGEKHPKSEHSMKQLGLSGSFFKEPHIPQSFENKNVCINPYQDMNPYNSQQLQNGNKLFQNVGAANEDNNECSLDDIFRQTQIKN